MSMIETVAGHANAHGNIIGTFPCTQTQQRCWFLDRLSPGNPALNVAVRWEIRGAFRTASIEAAFRQVIERHEILRTRLVEIDGLPRQQVVDRIDFRMPVIDLRNVPPEGRDERIQSIGRETAQAPFDLAVPGLLRVTFLTVENDRGFILITAHQSCFDGWSIRVLGREIGEIAAAIDMRRAPNLPELPLQYGDYALWQKEYLESYGFETEKAFWRERLAGAPYFEVRPDRPRGAAKTSRGEILSAVQPPAFGERMDAAARACQVSQFAYGAAIVSTMLHRFTGKRRILLGTQIAGRDDVDLESLIGVFINNLVLDFDVAGDTAFAEHVERAGATVNAALNHQRMPFNRLVELVNPPRDPARNPLVSVNFNLQKAFLENAHYGGFELISAPSQSPGVIYDLNFIMVGRPNGWRMSVEYNQDLFDQATAAELLRLWQASYELALANPAAPLDSFPAPSGERGERRADGKPERPAQAAAAPAGEQAATRIEALGRIWANVLGVEAVRPADDFFALGGHSLLALRMVSAVRDRFGANADLAMLFRQPTLGAFARELFRLPEEEDEEEGEAAEAAPVPALWESSLYREGQAREGYGALTVYTLNHPFLYYQLANALPGHVSVVNLHMFGAEIDDAVRALSIEDIVARAILAAGGAGTGGAPVAVVGLCVNGILAIEMARQLRQGGADVRFAVAIDSWAPGFVRTLPRRRRFYLNTLKRLKRAAYFAARLMKGRITTAAFLKEFNLSKKILRRIGAMDGPTHEDLMNAAVTQVLVDSARRYMPRQVTRERVMLFRSRANPKEASGLLFGWRPFVGDETQVFDIDGWHEDSLTSAGIDKLAAIIGARIEADTKL